MKLLASTLLALSSVTLTSGGAATRPRYGGTLTVELSARPDLTRTGAFTRLIVETLVRENEHGETQPGLASAWQHDPERKRWRFTIRPRVRFHDGRALDAASVTTSLWAALRARYSNVAITSTGQSVTIASDRPFPRLLSELALHRCAIVRKNDAGLLIGTGPFHITQWEPDRGAVLTAFADYWGGRPYLDSINLRFASGRAADVWDVPVGGTRRVLLEGTRLWVSQTTELLAIVVPASIPDSIRQALALSIDRASIVNVLTQRQGEATAALLPNWFTGYAFLFSSGRQLVMAQKSGAIPLSYQATDPLSRAVADRIAVNARDAGLIVQPTPASSPSAMRLVRLPIASLDAARALMELAAELDLPPPPESADSARPETMLQAERALLASHRVIPIAHLPQIYAIGPRVHYREASRSAPLLRLEDVWLDP